MEYKEKFDVSFINDDLKTTIAEVEKAIKEKI